MIAPPEDPSEQEQRGPAAGARRSAALHVSGELDLGVADALTRRLDDLSGAGDGDVMLDLSAVTFIDSTALGVLTAADNRLREAGRRVVIVEASPTVRRVLSMTGLVERLLDDSGGR